MTDLDFKAQVTESDLIGDEDVAHSRAFKGRISWLKYYESHRDDLKAKARERAARSKSRRLQEETPEEADARKARHRQAAAKYRENNRAKIRFREWKRRPENIAWIKLRRETAADDPDGLGTLVVGLFDGLDKKY